MIHVGRRPYPYMEEVNEGIVREFERLRPHEGAALDVGCGRGQLGQAIRALGWDVWGVESSDEAAVTAETRLSGLVRADLNDHERVRAALHGRSFDALVFSDVLEHVYDPDTVLERYLELLKPGGRVFVSVPNAVVWTNRFRWLLGKVTYEDTGVMDRTHIRFFTFETTKNMLVAAGCVVERVASTPYFARALLPAAKALVGKRSRAEEGPADPRAILDSPAYKAYMSRIYPAERAVAALWPEMFAFRIIVVGVKPV